MRSARLGFLAILAACSADPTALAPRLPGRPSSVLLPASAYPRALAPFPGRRSAFVDVNDKLQMVGHLEDDAILVELQGSVYTLNKAGAQSAEARAVNSSGAAAGWLVYAPKTHPVIWDTPRSPPLVRPERGWVQDMNDRQEAVGIFYFQNSSYGAFYWEGRTGLFTPLPFPRGATWTEATGINNDRTVVGRSDVGGVMWRHTSNGWVANVLRGIDPKAVDAGYGTVGWDGIQPVWGKPHYAGTLGVYGIAEGIHRDGTISGWVAASTVGQVNAFVADRSGGMTLLPPGPAGVWSKAYNSASCGLVVGSAHSRASYPNAYEAVYWDPGC